MANQPTWMGAGGAYEKNPGWWRSPNVGGGLQWNPEYGYQRRQDIEKGLASGKDISQWGLKANTGQDWRKLFPGARTDQELRGMGLYNKKTGNNQWQNFKTPGGWYDYSSWKPGWQPNGQQLSFGGGGGANSPIVGPGGINPIYGNGPGNMSPSTQPVYGPGGGYNQMPQYPQYPQMPRSYGGFGGYGMGGNQGMGMYPNQGMRGGWYGDFSGYPGYGMNGMM
jgi:hypothetical protein